MTRHATHAKLVCRALETGKAVFVEKPLALTREETDQIAEAVEKTGNDRLMVGFNRRFAPLLTAMRKGFGAAAGTSSTRYLVNAGPLAKDSWYLNEEAEGSRFAGEGGHFIDTLSWWADSLVEEVYAVRGPEKGDVQATFRFANGASGTIAYLTGGNARFPKETMDATGGGRSAPGSTTSRRPTVWTARGKSTTKARGGQDKGQQSEMAAFVEAVRTGGPMPISARLPAGHHAGHHRGGRKPAQRSSGAGVSATGTSKLGWYARRLGRMSPAEIAWRVREQARAARVGAPAGAPGSGRLAASLPRRCRRASAGSPPCCRRAPPRWCPTGPGRRSSPTRTGCSRASGRCSASSGPTWSSRTGSATR